MSSTISDSAVRHRTVLKPPSKWHVIILNDDTTPMDYVVDMLMSEYGHSPSSAEEIMLAVHHVGRGIAGTFSHEIAERKCRDTMINAERCGYRLQSDIERA